MNRSFLVFALLIAGCWSKEFQEPGRIEVPKKQTEATINAPFARVWAATQASLGKFPIVKKDMEANTGRAYVITDWVRGKSDILFHGFDVNRLPYVIRYKFHVYVVGDPRSGRSSVSIKSTEQYLDDSVTAGVDLQGGVYSWIKTESSGAKEFAILEQINKLALDPQFRP
jgi:hypothetical protein